MKRAILFIDGSWLALNMPTWVGARTEYSRVDYKMLLAKLRSLPGKIAHAISSDEDVEIRAVFYFSSIPHNYDPRDEAFVDEQKAFYEMLREECGYYCRYDKEIFKLNYRTQRIRPEDRGQGKTRVEEKEVDAALVTRMTVLAYEDAYDWAIVIAGDRDVLPGLTAVSDRGKRVVVVSIGEPAQSQGGSPCSGEIQHYISEDRANRHLVWLDDLFKEDRQIHILGPKLGLVVTSSGRQLVDIETGERYFIAESSLSLKMKTVVTFYIEKPLTRGVMYAISVKRFEENGRKLVKTENYIPRTYVRKIEKRRLVAGQSHADETTIYHSTFLDEAISRRAVSYAKEKSIEKGGGDLNQFYENYFSINKVRIPVFNIYFTDLDFVEAHEAGETYVGSQVHFDMMMIDEARGLGIGRNVKLPESTPASGTATDPAGVGVDSTLANAKSESQHTDDAQAEEKEEASDIRDNAHQKNGQ